MKKVAILASFFCLVAPVVAQQSWTHANTAELGEHDTIQNAHISASDRKVLLSHFNSPCSEVITGKSIATTDDIRIRRVSLGSEMKGFAVQGSNCYCSGDGNCEFILLNTAMKTLFGHNAESFTFLPTTTHGLFDLVTYKHGSATDGEQTLYRFDGKQYRCTQCVDVDYHPNPGSDEILKDPKITIQKCW